MLWRNLNTETDKSEGTWFAQISLFRYHYFFSHNVCSKVFQELQSFVLQYTVFLRLEDRVFFFQNNPKNQDPSYKTDLDLLNCLGRVKLVL